MSDATITREDLQMLAETAERFAKTEIAPHLEAWEKAGELPRDLHRRAAELGLLGLGYPEALGGTPAPWSLRNVLAATLARHGASGGLMASLFSHNIGLPPIQRHGSAELQAEVIPGVLRGENIAALAITEPGGGTDVSSLRTTAVRDGDEYVVNGEKIFITSGMRADWITAAVRTDPKMKGTFITFWPCWRSLRFPSRRFGLHGREGSRRSSGRRNFCPGAAPRPPLSLR